MKFITRSNLMLPKRDPSSHKGDNGRVLIIGGSKEYTGAIALAGIAALRSGSDSATILAPEKVAWAINALSPDLICIKAKGEYLHSFHVRQALILANKADCILLGNGIGQKQSTKLFLKRINKKLLQPKVIDADALKLLTLNEMHNSILSPHKAELEILLKNSLGKAELDPFYKNKTFMINSQNIPIIQHHLRNNVMIIKGKIDIILTKDNVYYNKTGNPGMTKSGTGDVLAGLCAGFASQHIPLLNAAVNASYINGLAGDNLLKQKKWYTYLASDLLIELKRLLK